MKAVVRNYDPYFKGLIKEFIREHVQGIDGNRKITTLLTELPDVAINEYLTDYNRLKLLIARAKNDRKPPA